MRLVILSGSQAGQGFEISRDVVVIGRDIQCDVPVSDIAASRNHSQIRRDQTGYVIQDMGSTNGTLVNGERISGARAVRVGDVITVGKTEIRLEESQTIPAFAVPATPLAVPQPEFPVMPSPARSESSNGIWIAAGVGLIVVLLIGIAVAVFLLLQPNEPAPSTPTAIAAALPTNAPTLPASATPPLPSSTPAPAPTLNTPAAGAASNAGATSTVPGCVECTRTPTPTSTATPTSTPTPTNTPTSTPTRQFGAPVLLSPPDKSKFAQYDAMLLQWNAVGNLRDMDQYYVQVSTRGEFQNDFVCWAYTQNTQVVLSGETCPNGIQFNARYFWRVGVVAPDANGKPTPVSPFSPIREFGWQP